MNKPYISEIFRKKKMHRSLVVLLAAIVFFQVSIASAQNSTRKNRTQPNEVSSKVGSAIKWSSSVEAAKKASKESGKPIFWYVATVPGTFMDRKPVIDRYMLGGIFSWPPIIQLINENFVPLRATPGRDSRILGIRPYQFVEPGFVILSGDKVTFRLDQLTTLHYGWLETLLSNQIKKSNPKFKKPVWPKYYAEFSGDSSRWIDPYGEEYEKNASNLLLSGMIAFRKGNHELAKQRWLAAAKAEPDSPLAWKASLEAQGIGPFGRGFEVFRAIPDNAILAGEKSRGSAAPKDSYSREEVVQRSVGFLLGMQRQDGAFVDSDYDFGGFDSMPNVHVAVTSLAGMALIKVAKTKPKNAGDLERAILKIEKYVTDPKNLNPADRDEILWAHSYRLRFLSRLAKDDHLKSKVENLSGKLNAAIDSLEKIQLKTGNWYHEYNNPFVTATALCALKEAENAGGKVDSEKIERGIKSLLLDRAANGAYPYYSVRRKTVRDPAQQRSMLAASAGRMPICELALVLWGEKKQKELVAAVENSLQNHKHLALAYKYDNHTSNMAYGGFFFWYDMRSRSEAIRGVEDEKTRSEFVKQHQAIVDGLPEIDGCFVDSHELGRCYGTAMAILSME